MLKHGIEHLVEQVVSYKINSLFWPKIESVVKEFLGISEIPSTHEKSSESFRSSGTSDKISDKTSDKTSNQSNDNSLKTQSKKISKKVETFESKPIVVKLEPQDPQPMDIETDSNSSVEDKKPLIETEVPQNSNVVDSDNEYVDWPTPPQPELLTPERPISYSPIETNKSNEESDVVVIKEENISPDINIKQNESFLINERIMDEIKQQKCETSQQKSTSEGMKEKEDVVVKDEELSDVSSVHTSDLSDFDDEISLDDSNDEYEENKEKKKISLKVVKKITQVLSNEQNSDSIKKEPKLLKQKSSEISNTESDTKSETKRVRKVNPKYSSEDFSSIFTEKERSVQNIEDSEHNKSIKPETSSRKRRHSNASDDIKESNDLISTKSSKPNRKKEEIQMDSRSSSRGSVESSLSETTQDSTQSLTRSQRSRKLSKNRFETNFLFDLF